MRDTKTEIKKKRPMFRWVFSRLIFLTGHSTRACTHTRMHTHTHIHGSNSQGNIIFQDISRRKYRRFKGNKLRYVWKSTSYLFNIWLINDIFMAQLLAVWSTHFYLNFNWHGISRLYTGTLFLLQLKFSSTGILFIRVFFHRQYFFQDLENEFVIF